MNLEQYTKINNFFIRHYNNSLDSLFMLYLIYLFDNEVYL